MFAKEQQKNDLQYQAHSLQEYRHYLYKPWIAKISSSVSTPIESREDGYYYLDECMAKHVKPGSVGEKNIKYYMWAKRRIYPLLNKDDEDFPQILNEIIDFPQITAKPAFNLEVMQRENIKLISYDEKSYTNRSFKFKKKAKPEDVLNLKQFLFEKGFVS
ncbi:hypothetical protein ACFL35_04155 [Candidatus Riflebacteria bacterium]